MVNDVIKKIEKRLTSPPQDLSKLSADEQYELITRHVFEVIKPDILKKKLKRGKPLLVKYGIDPTGKDVHLGHMVPVLILNRLQRMGHKIVLVFGDFTASVGDPSGRLKERPVLTAKEIKDNVATYKDQFSRFLNLKKTKIVYNTKFIKELSVLDLFELYRKNRLSPLLQREDFRKRIDGLSIAEALYPTLMAIDSIALKADLELGGKDQFLNFHTVVDFMESEGMEPEAAVASDMLLSLVGDGKKMSKSEGNYIGLNDEPGDVYGKIMSMPDNLMKHFFELLTDITDTEWQKLKDLMKSGVNPMEVKKMLARVVVALLYNKEEAEKAEEGFVKVFSKSQLPDDMPVVKLTEDIKTIVDLLVAGQVAPSKSEARRLVKSGAVGFVGGDKITDIKTKALTKGVVKVGKRRWLKVV